MRTTPLCCIGILVCALALGSGGESTVVAQQPATIAVSTEIKQAVAALTGTEFAQRQAAEKQLIAQGPAAFEPLIALLGTVPPEAGQRILLILEQIWIHAPEPQADTLERQLEDLRLTWGPYQPAMDRLLSAHHRLREQRAVRALRRLNAIVEEEDVEDLEFQIRPGPLFPNSPPRHIAQIILPRSWKGTGADLWHLQRLSHLKYLTVFVVEGNGITEFQKQQMQVGFPDLTVSMRAEVYLGVEGSPFGNQRGCYVSKVIPGSPAETAGLELGDTIMSVDGMEIHSFLGLVEALKSKRAYQPIELKIDPGYQNRFPHYPFEEGGKSNLHTLTAIGIPWEDRRFPTPPVPPLAESLPELPFPETSPLPGSPVEVPVQR